MPLTPTQVPPTYPYGLPESGLKSKGPTCVALKRAMSRLGLLPWQEFDEHFNESLSHALAKWDPGHTGYGEGRWEKIRAAKIPKGLAHAGEYALDVTAQKLIQDDAKANQPPAPKVPDLGPVRKGGVSVLLQDCTHATSGIPLYPAFDDCFGPGVSVYAPDDVEVWKKKTSANPGHAIYAKGAQKIDFWIAHIDRDYALGRTFRKGDFIGKTVPTDVGGGPHAHVGVNVERLWGAGKQLVHHTNYTHGAPLIGEQLAGHK